MTHPIATPRPLVLALTLLTLGAGLFGCMDGEVRHTIYLEPEGRMSWQVDERLRASTADTKDEQREEEAHWVHAVETRTHAAHIALDHLGARESVTHWQRRQQPYAVSTDAEFDDATDALERLMYALGIVGTVDSEATRRGGWVRVTVDVEATRVSEPFESEATDAIAHLLLFTEEVVFVASRGRFVSARGFELENDGRSARLDLDDTPGGGLAVYELAWQTD